MPAQETSRVCRTCGVTRVIQQFLAPGGGEYAAKECKWCDGKRKGINLRRAPLYGPVEEGILADELHDSHKKLVIERRLALKPGGGDGFA